MTIREQEVVVLPLWEETKYRQVLMLSNRNYPMRLELQEGQSLYFSKGSTLKGSEGFVEAPKIRSMLKLMYLGNDAWCRFDSVGEFNIVKKRI